MVFTAQQPYVPLCVMSAITFGTIYHSQIDVVRVFRDNVMGKSPLGGSTIRFYYATSPYISRIVMENKLLKETLLHTLVRPLIYMLKILGF